MAGAGFPATASVGTTVEVSEIESLTDGHIIVGDGSGAPTTIQAYATSAMLIHYFGGTTSSFPALKRASTVLQVRLADDSAATRIEALSFYVSGKAIVIDDDMNVVSGGMFKWSSTSNDPTASLDTGLARNAAGVVEVNTGTAGTFAALLASDLRQGGANGQRATVQHATSSATVTAGASHTFTNLIPAGSLVIGVTVRVTTVIGTGDAATGFSVGDGSDVDRWGSNISLAANTTTTGANFTIANVPAYPTVTSVVLTAVGGTFDGTGVVRATVHYVSLTAATS